MGKSIKALRQNGYPLIIKDEYGTHTLVDVQPLLDGDFEGIYRGRSGEKVIDLATIQKYYKIVEA